jgi:hypothetical protein
MDADYERLIHEARCWLADAGLPADDLPDKAFTTGGGLRVQVPTWLVADTSGRCASVAVVVDLVFVTKIVTKTVCTVVLGPYSRREGPAGERKAFWTDCVRPRRHLLPTDPPDAPRIVTARGMRG